MKINKDLFIKDFKDDFKELLQVCDKFGARPYFVGGCVRDYLLNIQSNDYDIELYDIDALKLEELAISLGAIASGKNFYVYKWRCFDIALARVENCIGKKHTDFEVLAASEPTEAIKRRDFSINAILLDARSFEIIDLVNGIDDLRAKILRPVNLEKFKEDALRVLRGVQFAARFGFRLSQLDYLKQIDLSYLSHSRIVAELLKLLQAKKPELGLYYLYKLGHLNLLNPSLRLTKEQFYKAIYLLKNASKQLAVCPKLVAFSLLYVSSLSAKDFIKASLFKKALGDLAKEPLSADSELELALIAHNGPIKQFYLGYFDLNVQKMAIRLNLWTKGIDCDLSGCCNKDEVLALRLKSAKDYLRNQNVKYSFS